MEKIQGRLRGIRGQLAYSDAFEMENATKASQQAVLRDFRFANKIFPLEAEYLQYLFWIFQEKGDPLSVWNYLYQLVMNSEADLYVGQDDFIENLEPQAFQSVLKDFIGRLDSCFYRKRLASTILRPFISRLHKEEKYGRVVDVVSHFQETELASSSVLFEAAYAHSDMGELDISQRFYELYLDKHDNSSSGWNNLGVINEQKGNLLKAKECFQKAVEIDSTDKRYKRNLKNVEKKLKEIDKTTFEQRQAIEEYRAESPYVQSKVIVFYAQRNEDGLIICSYRQAPQYLKMSGPKATEFLRDLLTKKYFLKVTNHEYDTQSSVYRINPYLEPELSKSEEALRNEGELLGMCERLNLANLGLIGYDDNLIMNIAKISSEELKLMLQRDLKENAIAVILKQNKSALVLSGSIIEAILTDRVLAKGITKYRIKNKTKNVLNISLNELLEIAEQEKIIDSTMAHLAHAVRGYRNLIHPGVEQRKATIQVSDSNVELAWGIVKKILNDIC